MTPFINLIEGEFINLFCFFSFALEYHDGDKKIIKKCPPTDNTNERNVHLQYHS